ncbi:MAG: penicillin-binding protein [Ruminococcaceae bacterium]|nr:penicillin-binding protein [Oscillospiraceae bacterium]
MQIKKSISLILATVITLFSLTSLSGCKEKTPSTVLGANGEKLAEITSTTSGDAAYTNEEYSYYIDFVVEDAALALAEIKGISKEDGAELLCSEGYTILTLFEVEAMQALIKAEQESGLAEDALFGGAVTNLEGAVTAVYSSGENDGLKNFALAKSQPYSAFKPLSVYTPALERGIINWATPTKDSPFKQITDENGYKTDWPTNSNGRYTEKYISIGDAVRDSVNTVSVHTLDKLGVKNSLDFLKNSFDLDLTEEREKVKKSGYEEIYGNLAMGYLIKGVSPVDMAGYYSIFANGGKYTKPYAVAEIKNQKGEVIYTAEPEEKQVICEETAYIMNRMLNTVVTRGGTGKNAAVSGVDICGKTGTGSVNGLKGNWFSGFTPQYSCAIWHGGMEGSNIAPDIFKIFASNMNNSKVREFNSPKNIQRQIFCAESGKLFTSNCGEISEGYFSRENIPEKCEGHSR